MGHEDHFDLTSFTHATLCMFVATEEGRGTDDPLLSWTAFDFYDWPVENKFTKPTTF